MKKIFLLIAVFAIFTISWSVPAYTSAQTTAKNDSITTALRLNTLQHKKESLQREIKIQDSKRNQQITGVSAETLEAINDKQDSLCLALRSELTDVILEIKELSPNVVSPQFINQYNNLINGADSTAAESSQMPLSKPQID